MNVVDLVEILPPQAIYPPIHWRIYTSHALQNIEQAQQIVQWYCWRWKIELLFATVKSSGLNLEFVLIDYGNKLKKLAILSLWLRFKPFNSCKHGMERLNKICSIASLNKK